MINVYIITCMAKCTSYATPTLKPKSSGDSTNQTTVLLYYLANLMKMTGYTWMSGFTMYVW